jgi:MoaA/NifB/PqqE/SkfB family radical SAM enzyme
MLGVRKRRALRALQIEVTSRCTRVCALGPRSVLFDRWREQDLAAETWRRLEPDLGVAEHVHLQGWGEPLLHPGLRRMVRACKASGCSVGITTNGDLLASALDWLLDEEVDLVTVSVAGDSDTHPRMRGGSLLEPVISAASELAHRSHERGGATRVQLSYLLTRENARDLPALLERAAHAAVDEVFVVHLDCTPSRFLLETSAFEEEGLAPGVKAHLDEAARVARRNRLRYRGPPLHPEELITCALDPLRFAFVNFEGRVGPCVYGLLPISGTIPRWSGSGEHRVQPLYFGTVRDDGLSEILDGKVRGEFLLRFRNRHRAEDDFLRTASVGFGVEALRRIERADRTRARAFDDNPFPRCCEDCHKARGW